MKPLSKERIKQLEEVSIKFRKAEVRELRRRQHEIFMANIRKQVEEQLK